MAANLLALAHGPLYHWGARNATGEHMLERDGEKMLCPACNADMFVLEFERTEIDYCPDCGGVWLDSGELELIGERAGALQGEMLAALEKREGMRTTGSGKRRCPLCRKALLATTTPDEDRIELDICKRGHGIWFDKGELGGVIHAAGAEKDNVLARFFARLDSAQDDA